MSLTNILQIFYKYLTNKYKVPSLSHLPPASSQKCYIRVKLVKDTLVKDTLVKDTLVKDTLVEGTSELLFSSPQKPFVRITLMCSSVKGACYEEAHHRFIGSFGVGR
jgi:hypothetical protein